MSNISLMLRNNYIMQVLPVVHPHPLLDLLEQELVCVKTVKLQEILVRLEIFVALELVLLGVETVLNFYI